MHAAPPGTAGIRAEFQIPPEPLQLWLLGSSWISDGVSENFRKGDINTAAFTLWMHRQQQNLVGSSSLLGKEGWQDAPLSAMLGGFSVPPAFCQANSPLPFGAPAYRDRNPDHAR